jgi:hypothetical protein
MKVSFIRKLWPLFILFLGIVFLTLVPVNQQKRLLLPAGLLTPLKYTQMCSASRH